MGMGMGMEIGALNCGVEHAVDEGYLQFSPTDVDRNAEKL